MKKFIVILCVVMFVLGITSIAGALTVTTYTNRTDWGIAVGGDIVTETFDDAIFEGLTIDSDFADAGVDNPSYPGKWYDRVSDYPNEPYMETTFYFAPDIYAFGGDWNLAVPGGPGQSILLTLANGATHEVGTIENNVENEFWGFVSDEAFVSVTLQAGTSPGAWAETYTLDDLAYAPVPEPTTMLLLGVGLLGLVGFLRKKK